MARTPVQSAPVHRSRALGHASSQSASSQSTEGVSPSIIGFGLPFAGDEAVSPSIIGFGLPFAGDEAVSPSIIGFGLPFADDAAE